MIDERKAGEVLNALRACGPARIQYEGADGLFHGSVDALEVWRKLPQGYREHVATTLWAVLVKGEAPTKLPVDRHTRNAGKVLRVLWENLSYAVDQGMNPPTLPGDPPSEAEVFDLQHRAGVLDYLCLKVIYEGTPEAIIEYAHQYLTDTGELPPERECFMVAWKSDTTAVEKARELFNQNMLSADFRAAKRGSQEGYYVTLRKGAVR